MITQSPEPAKAIAEVIAADRSPISETFTFAAKVEISGSTVTVTRETDTGEQVVELTTPAVVTTDLRLNEPRYVALPGIIKARSKPLEKQTVSDVASVKLKTIAVETPAARPAGRKVGSVSELASAIKERGVI